MNRSVCCAVTTGRRVLSSVNSSDFHSWEDQVLSTFHSEAAWWVCEYNGSPRSVMLLSLRAQFAGSEVIDVHIWLSLGLSDAVEASTSGGPFTASRDQIHHWFRLCCDSFFTWIFLCSFRHHFSTICKTQMADVKQTQKMIPCITREISLLLTFLKVGVWCWYICVDSWGPD